MYKVAICGKAKSGKNTIAKLLKKSLSKKDKIRCKYLAFADPVKEIARIMFPSIPEEHLTGSSELRSSIIKNAFKNDSPLTVRQLLIDIGTEMGRSYDKNIWINALGSKLDSLQKKDKDLVILTDCRFINEHNFLKSKGFFTIKVIRNDSTFINHISETEQDGIPESDFDAIIYNNGTLKQLKKDVSLMAYRLHKHKLENL